MSLTFSFSYHINPWNIEFNFQNLLPSILPISPMVSSDIKERKKREREQKRGRSEEEPGHEKSKKKGGEKKKRRVSRWWRSRGISTRFVHAGNLSGLPSGRAFVITWAYGEHKRLGCTHVRLPRTRVCTCVRRYVRAGRRNFIPGALHAPL